MNKPEEVFEGYVTKYALTIGIQKVRLRVCSSVSDNMTKEADKDFGANYHGEGREWHRTYASAHRRAEQMRKAKIASLKKSLALLAVLFPEQEP